MTSDENSGAVEVRPRRSHSAKASLVDIGMFVKPMVIFSVREGRWVIFSP